MCPSGWKEVVFIQRFIALQIRASCFLVLEFSISLAPVNWPSTTVTMYQQNYQNTLRGWPGNLVLGVAWLWRQEDISVYYNQWGILYPPLTLEWCKYVCVSVKFILGGTLHYNWRERWQSYNVILTWRVSLLWRNPIRDRSVYFETSNWESERHPRRQQRGTRRVFSESEQKYLRNKNICTYASDRCWVTGARSVTYDGELTLTKPPLGETELIIVFSFHSSKLWH